MADHSSEARLAAHPDTVIVGGGLAGLSCARELGAGFALFEADERLGGLCRTEQAGGYSFDWTGHWLHARDPEMRALIEGRWLAGNLLTVERRALIHSQGVWTRFPYQIHTHGLPPATVAECLVEFVKATEGEEGRALRERPLRNAAEFIQRHLGAGFAKHFLIPYNEKLFTIPVEELSPEWGGRFIPRPGLQEVVRGALGIAPEGAGYNATFWYPREGGIEALVRGLAREVRELPGQVRTDARVARLDLRRRALQLASGDEVRFEQLVLTLPLQQLSRLLVDPPAEVQEALARLRAVSVTVVEIGGPDAGGERFHWAYFPERRFPFYRIGSPSEVHRALAPPGCRSFALEFSHRGPAEHAALIEQSLRGLEELRLIDRARVQVARARTIPCAYVLFDQHHEASRAQVLSWLAAQGVRVAGRYGRWEYSSMEDALLSGRDAARAVREKQPR
jgi:protoporphyrinogen oxidase